MDLGIFKCFFFSKLSNLYWMSTGSDNKEPAFNVGDLGSIPGLGGCPGGGQPTPVVLPGESQWTGQATVHGVTELDMTERLTLSHAVKLTVHLY